VAEVEANVLGNKLALRIAAMRVKTLGHKLTLV